MTPLDETMIQAFSYGLIAGSGLAGLVTPLALILWALDLFTSHKGKKQ